MKNRKEFILTVIAGIIFFTVALLFIDFEEEQIYYEGVNRPTSEVQEIIADKLEIENPSLDIEVTITTENE